MTTYVIYDPATGEISAMGEAVEPDAVPVPAGLALLPTTEPTPRHTHHVLDGTPVAYTPEQAAAKALPPHPGAVWSNTAMVWQDARTVEQARAQAWERIKRAREAFWDAPLQTPFGTFDHGPKARSDIAGAVQLLQLQASRGLPSDVDYTLADNSTRTLTLAQMEVVGLLAGKRINDGFTAGRTLRTQIDAATTPAEVDAVQWPAAI